MENLLFNTFFVIDSEKLDYIHEGFYGYSFNSSGIYDRDNPIPDANELDGNGTYISVSSESDKIIIKQDYLGCFGIYKYECEGYFCISNSLYALADHLREITNLHINTKYYHHMFSALGSSLSFNETSFEEIDLLPRDVEIVIDKKDRSVNICPINYYADTVSLFSKEGIELVDCWYDKYTKLIESIVNNGGKITIDVTGGFDSRIVLMLILCSNISFNDISFVSFTDNNPVHQEDYRIADMMARRYGFILNKPLNADYDELSSDDILDYEYYVRWGITKELSRYDYSKKYKDKIFSFTGSGGELLRGYGIQSWDELMDDVETVINEKYSWSTSKEVKRDTEDVLNESFNLCKNRNTIDEEKYTGYTLYSNTRARSHYGKYSVRYLLNNQYIISPHLDSLIKHIKTIDSDYSDPLTLFALLLDRFLPSLLEYPFEGKREINEKTINAVRSINCKYPRYTKTHENQQFSMVVSSCDNESYADENLAVSDNYDVRSFLISLFKSRWCKGTFCTLFEEELYNQAFDQLIGIANGNHFYQMDLVLDAALCIYKNSNIYINNILGASRLLHDISELYPQNCSAHNTNKTKWDNRITARIDVYMENAKSCDFELVNISDDNARVYTPKWINKSRRGYMIHTQSDSFTIRFSVKTEGVIHVVLSGVDYRKDNKSIPLWINYSSLEINQIQYLYGSKRVWLHKPFSTTINAFAGSELVISAIWSPDFKDME